MLALTEVNCTNGESIVMDHFCDGFTHCSDGSDEQKTDESCANCEDWEIA